MLRLIFLLIPLFLLARPEPSSTMATLTVRVTNIRSTSGTVPICLFTSDSNFQEDIWLKRVIVPKTNLQHGELVATFQLPVGTYGIGLMDDENGNGEMDYGLFLPEEGFGFSNYYHTGLSRPHFDDFKFTLTSTGTTVTAKMKYM